ncbi:YktB family protein [Bacillus piscicola]|uniref:YktB family protein n=1 Tax=Bacillus piscicola TaxID=1632684 RepID=UPI001F09A4C7|nr:DUF1054 domain-containing protein [Bacillus piscicola]
MTFQGFEAKDFDSFDIDGLENRMEAIQSRIQPKFQEVGSYLTEELSMLLGKEMHLHIAKHARRTKNPPQDTWLGIADNKRGYKKHPHFQVGLFDDHLFLWLAYIYEMPNKEQAANSFLKQQPVFKELPGDFRISLDHTKKDSSLLQNMNDEDLTKSLERFRDVKKGEFLIGRHLDRNDPILRDGERFLEVAKETFTTLVPFYNMSYEQIG